MADQENPSLIHETIIPMSIEEEIKQSYIDYAMAVIVSRALPDTRDGLKPVIRRILYAMYDMKNFFSAKHKKSARIVGEVLGKYHPHGDSSVYDAMVRQAQWRSLRYPLIDGQGNFGSIDGDGAAAMRYTEARLTKLAETMLADIELNTVQRRDNFDGSLQEPSVLPTRFPNHLCNGTMGIAVGMATNMPPHNLREVIDACLYFIKHNEKIGSDGQPRHVTVDEIMDIIQGPDLPTGGIIFNPAHIREVYRTGRGSIVCRGKTHREEDKKHGSILVIDELPYQVNKASLVEKIAHLVMEKKIEGIDDIRDESSGKTIRIALYLKKGVNADKLLVLLFKMTELQSTININNVALVDEGIQPRTLNIRDLIAEFVEFRRIVVIRRSIFLLDKAQARLHLLEGLQMAIDQIDAVIATIRASATKAEAKDRLIQQFAFSEPQADYILMMRLQSLVGLELQKILDEMEAKRKEIEFLQEVLNNPAKRDDVVSQELIEVKEQFGDERRTSVATDTSVGSLNSTLKSILNEADKVKEDTIVWIGNDWTVRVMFQSRIMNIPSHTRDIIYTHNQDNFVIITSKGELVVQRLKDMPGSKTSDHPLDLKKHFGLTGDIVFVKTVDVGYDYLSFLTSHNNIKKIDKNLVLSFKKFPTVVMNLVEQGEKIISVLALRQGDKIGIVSQGGYFLLFPEDEVRASGKTAGGIKAIDLQEGDTIADSFLYRDEAFVLVYNQTHHKMLAIEDLRIWKRAKKGDKVATENITGCLAIDEGSITIKYIDGDQQTIHSNDLHLTIPEKSMKPLGTKIIEAIFQPWEEKKENKQYREAKKAEEKAHQEKKANDGLFGHTGE
ncbi:MAG: DNA topoisomerase 4 subunit A [Candidatus Absconditabacterales bacterium]|nr:DNA topoisomerase 4 subunit A [Candidatus Absconditabacterales bacterium]